MKVFETFDSPTVHKNPEKDKAMTRDREVQGEGKKVKNKKTNNMKTREKPTMSPEDIRTKVANKNIPEVADKVEISKTASKKKLFEFGDTAEVVPLEEAKAPTDPKHLLKADVGLNDPGDPATVGKLKKLISEGAVQFNPKERETLAKIIAEK